MFYYIFFACLILCALYCLWRISVTDFKRRIIPDIYLFPLLIIGFVIICWFPWVISPQHGALGALFGYILPTITGVLFEKFGNTQSNSDPSPIGLGDIKLISTGGLWLGPSGLAGALVLSCILGIIWGRTHNQRYIPFAPFFAIGGILSLISMCFLL